MPSNRHTSDREDYLEQALGKLLGLSHLYLKQLSKVKNQRIREALEQLAEEKGRLARILEQAISRLGGDLREIRIHLEHPVSGDREIIPRIYQEEEALSLWLREEIHSVRDEGVKALLQSLLKDEDRHLRIIKDLYRDLTHC